MFQRSAVCRSSHTWGARTVNRDSTGARRHNDSAEMSASTAATLVPAPVVRASEQATTLGVLYFGSTSPAMHEALDSLHGQGIHLDAMRLCAFPFAASVAEFIAAHERVFVVEQNRDAQLRTLMVAECGIDPAKLVPVLNYDGNPITARFIVSAIAERMAGAYVKPLRKAVT